MSRARDLLARPTIVRRAALVAALLSSPALFHGFEVDDRLQRQAVLGQSRLYEHGVFDLFTFLDGDPQRTLRLIDHGLGAWFSDLNARIAFFRPISSLLMWLDYRFVRSAFLVHLHSIAWYAAAVALAAVLYRRMMSVAWVAGLAAIMFALDHSHGLLSSWIAQRNALVAGVFGLSALLLHDRARQRGATPVLAPIALGLALFSAEAGLGAVPYLFAYAWFLDDRRWRTLAPYVVPILAWAAMYRLGQHGVRGSGLYVDPLQQPLAFLGNVGAHGPVLVATELGMPATELYPFVPFGAKATIVALSLLMIGAFVVALNPVFRRDPVTRFFVVGALLSVIPSCAAFPSARLTFFASFGAIGAIAQLVAAWRDGERLRAMPIVYWSGLGHLFLSPFAFLLAMHQMTILERIVDRNAAGLPDVAELEHQRVVVVNAPDATFLAYLSILRAERGEHAPEKLLAMAAGVRPLDLRRDDDKTLTLSSPIALVQPGTDLLARAATPFAVGYRVALSDVTIEITAVNDDGWPTEARFRFARPLEDPSLRFMQWQDQTLKPLPLPHVGDRRSFPAQQVQLF